MLLIAALALVWNLLEATGQCQIFGGETRSII
jgi:hypothetical protein